MSRTQRLALFAIAGITIVLAAPFVGGGSTPGGSHPAMEAKIFWELRVPRVLLAFAVGACLALSGMTFQSLFRNDLASPYTLGIASGAALGAAIVKMTSMGTHLPGSTALCAFLGAAGSVALLFLLASCSTRLSAESLLLAGIALSFFYSSLILFLQYLSSPIASYQFLRWMMGTLQTTEYKNATLLLGLAIAGGILLTQHAACLDLLSIDDLLAASRGVDVARTQRRLLIAVSLLVGAVVSLCGPIGFVGLMAPHMARTLTGPAHRLLTPVSFMMGGIFLVLCDTAARTVIAPAEIPVGVLTALLGGPFFIGLLLWDRRCG